jgi:hypothetical protein
MFVAVNQFSITSLCWMLFSLGLPLVNGTKISPPSIGRTFENSVAQMTLSSAFILALACLP